MDEELELKELLEQKKILEQKIKAIRGREVEIGSVKYHIRQPGKNMPKRCCVSVYDAKQYRWKEIVNEGTYTDAKARLKKIIEDLNNLYKQM